MQNVLYIINLNGNYQTHLFQNRYKSIKEGLDLRRRPELVGGGLIRSLGGWSEVLAVRNRKERHAFDSRILGDSEFVQEIKTDLDDMIKKNLRISGQRIDLQALCDRVCKKGAYH